MLKSKKTVEEPSSELLAVPTLVCKPKPFERQAELRGLVIDDDQVIGNRTPPLSAEQVFYQEHGLIFWEVNVTDRVALQSPSWPWHVACCWIASQTTEGAAEGVASFREWGGRIWRGPPRPGQERSLKEAEAMLKSALREGRVKARFMGPDGVVVVPQDDWEFLEWEADATGEVVEFEHLLWNSDRRYGPVILSRVGMRDEWKPLDEPQAAAAEAPAENSAAARKRPRKLDERQLRDLATDMPKLNRDGWVAELESRAARDFPGQAVDRDMARKIRRDDPQRRAARRPKKVAE